MTDNDSYIHVGLYILVEVELPLLATFVGGSDPRSESPRVRKFQGANGLGSEKSIIQ